MDKSRGARAARREARGGARSGPGRGLKRRPWALAALACLLLALTLAPGAYGAVRGNPEQSAQSQSGDQAAPDYSLLENWACWPEGETGEADVFFVCPTVYLGEEGRSNMDMDDQATKENFLGAINMEKGIYQEAGRFYAPYYRQVGLTVYTMAEEEREPYLALAYEDVAAAFDYYLEQCNQGRPIILAGFSQGADMCLRLLKDRFADPQTQSLLVACYAIGWRITQQEMEAYPHLRFAAGAEDTGVIIAFNSEAENVTQSVMIPAGVKTLAINPLNWRTDEVPAGKEANAGACFTDYSGQVLKEIPQLTGAYIDPVRGALKVPDVSPEEYPPVIQGFDQGVYHVYDYQFFYRNLQENVALRLAAYLEAQETAQAAA